MIAMKDGALGAGSLSIDQKQEALADHGVIDQVLQRDSEANL